MYACADPYIAADFDRLGVTAAVNALVGIGGMIGSVNTDTRAKEDMVSDFDAAAVQQDAVKIRKEIAADGDI